jgi:uncharacterized oligopeptide transporter (OPT) family protein
LQALPDHSSALDLSHLARPKPIGLRVFTFRAVFCGFLVAALMGAAYPYVVLKLGFGPNVSVVAAILGYVALGLVIPFLMPLLGLRSAPYNRWENNIVETAGTAASQTAFLCVLLAAFDMLRQRNTINFQLTEVQSFAWLTCAGLLGIFLSVPLRRHYIVEEKLPFVDGMAAGETMLVCDAAGPTAVRAAVAMIIGMAASALLMTLVQDSHVFERLPPVLTVPDVLEQFHVALPFSVAVLATTGVGINWSLLAAGSGMLLGLRINLSMLLGAVLSWVIAPYALEAAGVLPAGFKRLDVLLWVMWPATGMLVAGGLASLVLRWRVLARSFRNLSAGPSDEDDLPLRWVIVGVVVCGTALVVVQYVLIDQPIWITVVAILLSAPLALVGLRVLGETNWGPISALSNLMQGVFGVLAPGNVAANMVASGTTGSIAASSESIMQDFRAGQMVGSSPRHLTYMQLLATPIGAAAVAWIYPVLRAQYGIGEEGLSSPISRKWAGFAEVLSKGLEALPAGALHALIVGVLVGIVLAVLETLVKNKSWIPSGTGVGIGMLVPASVIVTMVLGGVVALVWSRSSPKTSERYLIPLASGLIAGEALVAVIVPLLVVAGVLHA